jgi:hypothetical protein
MIQGLHTSIHSPRIWLVLAGLSIGLLIGQVAAGQSATFNPPYPRIVAHKMGGGWSTVDPEQLKLIARHHVADIGVHRKWSVDGYNSATLSKYLKSLNPNIKLLHAANIGQNGWADDPKSADYEIKLKTESCKGPNGNGDWWLRTATGENITGWGGWLWRANFTNKVTPDAHGRTLPQWYFLYLYAKNSDGIDFVTKGTGLREGSWDGIFQDDQNISYGGHVPSNADYDEDGRTDDKWGEDVRTWVMEGHRAFRNAIKAKEPNWYLVANMATQLHPTETVPASFQGLNDGGFFERITFVETTRGWHDMMDRYRRGLSYLNQSGPKLGYFHNDINSLRKAYPNSGFSDYRLNRYGMTSALMANGYYIVSDDAKGGYKTVLWFDEQWGGSLEKVGYLGYPVDPPQTSAWSQGVYRREFDNGLVLVNPKGNGARTVNVGSGWKRLSGRQDPVHNNGQAVTSITLAEQDGIILLRQEAREPAASPNPPELLPPE